MAFARAPVEHQAYELITRIRNLRTSDRTGSRALPRLDLSVEGMRSLVLPSAIAAAIFPPLYLGRRDHHRDSAARCEFSFVKVERG
jgi:hypothetical protein